MSLLVDKHIKSALFASSALTTATNNRIYPVVAPVSSEIKFPYVTFAIDGTTEAYTKEGSYGMEIQVEIMVVTKQHQHLGQIAELVRKAMDNASDAVYNEFSVVDQMLNVGAEDKDIVQDSFFIPMKYTIVTEYNE